MNKNPEKQIDRFKQAARELGCDESEAAFDEKIKAIVRPATRPEPTAPTKSSKAARE